MSASIEYSPAARALLDRCLADIDAVEKRNQPMNTVPVPADIDPAVLEPGTTVLAMLDDSRTPLTVVRHDLLVVCRKPDGSEVTLYAHEVYVP